MRTLWIALVLFVSTSLVAAAQPPLQVQGPAGLWEGSINGPQTLPVVVRLSRAADGTWTGTIDIPAQGAKGLPLEGITVDGQSVQFAIAGVPGAPTFAGILSADATAISGGFTQGAAKLTFALRRNTTGVPTLTVARPQEPKPPFPYNVEAVTIPNVAAGVTLAGVLTTPRTGQSYPVVIDAGSGAQIATDHRRSQAVLLLADYLTRRTSRSCGSTTVASVCRPAIRPLRPAKISRVISAAVNFLNASTTSVGLVLGYSEGG
jgi:hypothetical protein